MSDVIDNEAEHRFEVTRDGYRGELTYELKGDRITLIHTGVPEELAGHGFAGQLVEAAVERARREQLTIIPICPYARRYLKKRESELADVKIDWAQEPLS